MHTCDTHIQNTYIITHTNTDTHSYKCRHKHIMSHINFSPILRMSLGWIIIIYVSQIILCKLLFVRSGGGKFVVITNKYVCLYQYTCVLIFIWSDYPRLCRRLFHWFSYTLFVYNAILGLLMAVVRLLLSALFSLLLLIRMDRVVLMKGFEAWDFGEHGCYTFASRVCSYTARHWRKDVIPRVHNNNSVQLPYGFHYCHLRSMAV